METADKGQKWHFRLYIAGDNPKSKNALSMLEQVCKEHIPGECRIEVINLMNDPHIALEDDIIATPTVVRKLPPPVRKLIGDLMDEDKVILGLEILADLPENSPKTKER